MQHLHHDGISSTTPPAPMVEEEEEAAAAAVVHAQDLGPYPLPAPNCTVLSSADGGHAGGGPASGGGRRPADPAAQEELFVDASGTSAVWRSLGGQIAHTSFRSVVLGPTAALEGGLRGGGGIGGAGAGVHGAITQAVRCRFPTLLEGWSSTRQGGEGAVQVDERRRQRQRRRRGPWSVCILRHPDLVTVHHPRGDSHDVTLPCEARLLQPLGEGLLVQRYAGGGGGDGFEFSSAAAYGEEEEQEEDGLDPPFSVPSLFTLLHPLDELRPVALLPPAASAGGSNELGGGGGGGASSPAPPPAAEAAAQAEQQQQQRLVCDASEHVVFARGGGDGGTGRDASLLLTYHMGRRRHSLWLATPVPEPEKGPEPEEESESLLATAGGISVSGSMMVDQSPGGGVHSWAATPGLSSTRAVDTSSLSSTLLGVSALKSPSSAAGVTMMDAVLDAGNPRRDRLSAGGSMGRGRLSTGGGGGGGAGRRASSGSNTSWIGAGNTRNEALASALGLGQSGLGVASNMLSLSAPAGHHERAGGVDPFLLNASSSMALGGTVVHHEEEEDEEDEEQEEKEGAQPIRPHLGISLVWREAEGSPAPAQHVFCAEGGAPGESTAAGSASPSSSGSFLLCFVERQAARLRALSVSFSGGDGGDSDGGGVEVREAFSLPCRSAVGLCATGGGEAEGTPGAAISADILVLGLDGNLTLFRGGRPVTRVARPAVSALSGGAGNNGEPECISEAVGSCFTLTTRGGGRRRLRLSLDPSSPLVSACLGAWDSLLSAPLAASLRADIASAAHSLAGQEERPREAGAGTGTGSSGGGDGGGGGGGEKGSKGGVDGDLDWAALVSVLRDLVSGTGESAHTSLSGRSEDLADRDGDGDDWEFLLASPFHDEFSRANAMMLSGFHHATEPTVKGQPRGDSLAFSSGQRQQQQHVLQTRRRDFLSEAGAVFDALHLVLEDLKTSRFTTSLVPRLASLLLSLTRMCGDGGTGMRDFADHYWRDAAGCGHGDGETTSMIDRSDGGAALRVETGAAGLPNRPTRFDKVPCFRSWVHARIRTGKVAKGADPAVGPLPVVRGPRYSGVGGPFPTLPKASGVLQATRRFCRFYTIICGGSDGGGVGKQQGTGRGTAPAAGAGGETGASFLGPGFRESDWVGARLVAAMVEEGYRAEDLERAPLGLTLPLLEVLHAASSQALVEWPAAAQELVGRQDLSALRRMLGSFGDGGGGDGSGCEGEEEEDDDEEGDGFGETEGYWTGGRISGSGAGARDATGRGAAKRGGGVALGQAGGGGSGGGPAAAAAAAAAAASPLGAGGDAADLDGLAWVDELSSLRFGRDQRVREACRLLRGSRPVRFHVDRSPESSDHDHQQRQQARLLQLAMRTLAGPLGRGMLTLGTLAPLLAEPLPIPPLCLAGRIRKPADVVVNLDLAAAAVPPDTTAWAEFHNGVAAGLRLQHEWGSNRARGGKDSGGGGGGAAASSGFEEGGVSRTWITYNRPAGGANNAHGGLLMALGLQGHLSSLAMTDVFEYLTLGQESTTVGVLLGMAAARRGSADLSTHKMLCLHVPSLLPHPFADMDTSSVTQAAALAGVGLLYQGTSHRLMTEFLLGEMGRAPCSDRFADREGYALACGLSLGMINLAKGASGGMAGVADLKLEQQLHRYMSGGKEPSAAGGGDPSGPGNRGGFSSQGTGGRGGGSGGGRAANGPSGGGGGGGGGGGHESTGPSRISAGEYVNTDVTAPAALLALALIHVRSGDKALAARLALPQTHFQLDYARPEQLLLRVVVKGLVMWDEVHPTDGWIESQIPEVVSVEYARLNEPLPEELSSVVDRQTIRQAHANIIAGGCLCLGLRFAGTADEQAKATVLSRVRHFKALRESVGGGSSGGVGRDPPIAYVAARRPERPVLEMCLSTSVTALGMIMAGTGDVECLRVMRELRGRVEGEVTYGTHMAIAMSIGLLFLGGGMASLGRDNEHIAALLGAFFPRYPATADDNQYHLQALRHLYVLAVQRRGVDAVDVDTGESLFVPIKVSLAGRTGTGTANGDGDGDGGSQEGAEVGCDDKMDTSDDAEEKTRTDRGGDGEGVPNGGSGSGGRAAAAAAAVAAAAGDRGAGGTALSLVTPCVLPDLKDVSKLSICSPRYFPVDLDIEGNPAVASALRRRCRIYVKRRVGHLSYKNDPHALRSLLFQSYPGAMGAAGQSSLSPPHHHAQRGHHHHNHGHGHGAAAAAAGEDPVQSKADFLSTFTEDPHLLNFARHFCDSGGAAGGGGRGSGISSGRRLMLGVEALGDAAALARYFGGALLECLAGEKAEALGPHLSLCHSTVTAAHTVDTSAAWDLRLVLDYGRGSALQSALMAAAVGVERVGGGTAGEVGRDSRRRRRRAGDDVERGRVSQADAEVEEPPLPFTLVNPDLLASLEVRLDVFFSSLGFYGDGDGGGGTAAVGGGGGGSSSKHLSRLWRYLYGRERGRDGGRGEGASGGDKEAGAACRQDRLFGAYLAYFGIPAPAELLRALGGREIPPEGLGLADTPALLRGLPGLTPSALLKIT